MEIFKILNNNVVVIKNKKNIEQIVMGTGIGFKKKKGDLVEESKVDKVFFLSNQDIFNNFQELIVKIPPEHIQLGEEIVALAKLKLGRRLDDMIYISLTDHIYTAIIRSQEGINIKNFLLWETKRFYKIEYEIGLEALDLIEEKFGIRLSDDEAGFIALHLVNASLADNEFQDVYKITEIMQEITKIVKYEFNFEFNEDSIYYYRFITHLKFFANRLVSNAIYKNNNDDDLVILVKNKYPNAYNTVNKITEFISTKYNYTLSDEEKVYLTIHIHRVVYEV